MQRNWGKNMGSSNIVRFLSENKSKAMGQRKFRKNQFKWPYVYLGLKETPGVNAENEGLPLDKICEETESLSYIEEYIYSLSERSHHHWGFGQIYGEVESIKDSRRRI